MRIRGHASVIDAVSSIEAPAIGSLYPDRTVEFCPLMPFGDSRFRSHALYLDSAITVGRRISFGGCHEKTAARILSLTSRWHRVRPSRPIWPGLSTRASSSNELDRLLCWRWRRIQLYNAEGTQFTAAALSLIRRERQADEDGTVKQGGCDYQFSGALSNWIVGRLATTTSWASGVTMSGLVISALDVRENDAWSAGGRIGYLVKPTVLAYVCGGYTEAHFGRTNYSGIGQAAPRVRLIANLYGWFLGGGIEYAFTWLPIRASSSEANIATRNSEQELQRRYRGRSDCRRRDYPAV